MVKNVLKIVLPNRCIQWLNFRRENLRFYFWRVAWWFREKYLAERFQKDPFKLSGIYWIKPEMIKYKNKMEFNYYRDHNLVIGGDWDTNCDIFQKSDFYISYKERLFNNTPWQETFYYKKYLTKIQSGKVKWGCKNKEEWDKRCQKLDLIFKDIKSNGYRNQKIEDYISANIDRFGRLIFNDGRHRLTFALLSGTKEIPIRITVRHENWILFKNQIFDYAKKREGKVYAPLTHFDLKNVPSLHGFKRADLIKKVIGRFEGRRIVDVGTHWGFFCHVFEDQGAHCYCIENDPENLFFLKRLKKAEERKFEIFEGSFFDFEFKKTKFDLILSLSVFHHLVKTEWDYNKLKKLLRRIQAEVMIFEPPDPEEPQMLKAYKNYSEKEFCQFIIDNSKYTKFEKIGNAEDGRSLFKIH